MTTSSFRIYLPSRTKA